MDKFLEAVSRFCELLFLVLDTFVCFGCCFSRVVTSSVRFGEYIEKRNKNPNWRKELQQ
jgi:hypothetical protein